MPKRAVFERSRQELSLDVWVGVHILLVVGQSSLESQSRGCAKTSILAFFLICLDVSSSVRAAYRVSSVQSRVQYNYRVSTVQYNYRVCVSQYKTTIVCLQYNTIQQYNYAGKGGVGKVRFLGRFSFLGGWRHCRAEQNGNKTIKQENAR